MGGVLLSGPTGLLMPGRVRYTPPRYLAIPDGLTGYWPFDTDTINFASSKALDMSGSGLGLDGALTGLPASALTTGQVGYALTFDGSTSVVNCGGASTFTTTPLTVIAWIRPTTLSAGGNTIVSKYNGAGASPSDSTDFVFYLPDNTGVLYFYMFQFSNTYIGRFTTAVVPTNLWTHVVATYNGGTTPTSVSLYINGQKADTNSDSAGSYTQANGAAPVRIGAYASASLVSPFTGQIDDVRIYKRTLDAAEILFLYQAGLSGRRYGRRRHPEFSELSMMSTPAAGGAFKAAWAANSNVLIQSGARTA